MQLSCPHCSRALEVAPGVQVGCPGCGALVGEPARGRVVPEERYFSERVGADAVRFFGRGPLVLPIVFGVLGLFLLGVPFLVLDAGAPAVAYVIVPMLPVFFLGMALLAAVHSSEVTVDRPAACACRSRSSTRPSARSSSSASARR